ncbi:MAG: CotH kinase family protein [Myxococcota bacterium]
MLPLLACSETRLVAIDDDAPAPATSAETVPSRDSPALVLNEVQADNDSTVMDATLAFPDWVEILNAGEAPVDLADVTLEEGGGEAWTGEGVLGPGERALAWGLPIDGEGDTLVLSVAGEPVDHLATGRMAGDTAWARIPDGGDWALTGRPTPGDPNGSLAGDPDPSEALFDPARVHRMDLWIPDASRRALDADPYGEVVASFGFEGAWFPEVGVRIKGVWGSLRTLDQKVALKVDLNAYAPHRLRGLETLTLNNMVQDPTYVHEALAYALFREAGLPASRTGWVELWIDGEFVGFYVHVETVDDTFLARWWADPGGALYEGAYGVDFYVGDEAEFEYDEGPDPDDRADLTAVAELLDEPATDANLRLLEARVDVDQVLKVMAIEALSWHWDGYTTANNYRVYHDPHADRFQMIPWGLDQTFVDERYAPYEGYGRLLTWCLENASCEARYSDALLEMADHFEAMAMPERFDEVTAFVDPFVATDPRRESGDDTRAYYLEVTREHLVEAPERVRAAVAAR